MTVGSSIGYVKAEYESFDNGQCTIEQVFTQYYIVDGAQYGSPGTASVCSQDLEGKPLDNAPEWTTSTYVQYDFDLGENLLGIARLEHSFIDSFYLDQDLPPGTGMHRSGAAICWMRNTTPGAWISRPWADMPE
jgi:iron complex outermembrane receptor protein